MSEYKTPKEILENNSMHGKSVDVTYISAINAMKEYGDQRYAEGAKEQGELIFAALNRFLKSLQKTYNHE